jgi:phosphohistidine phosphatase
MRHGDAAAGDDDFQRALSPSGRASARAAGQRLALMRPSINLVLTSTALRTLQTVEEAIEGFGSAPPPVQTRDSLYLASQSAVLGEVATLPDSVECVLVVGHNPALSELASRLRHEPLALKPGDYATVELGGGGWRQLLTVV